LKPFLDGKTAMGPTHRKRSSRSAMPITLQPAAWIARVNSIPCFSPGRAAGAIAMRGGGDYTHGRECHGGKHKPIRQRVTRNCDAGGTERNHCKASIDHAGTRLTPANDQGALVRTSVGLDVRNLIDDENGGDPTRHRDTQDDCPRINEPRLQPYGSQHRQARPDRALRLPHRRRARRAAPRGNE
jgi:hypothetical protein